MRRYLKKTYLFSTLILLFIVTAIILSSCGGGEGNLGISSTPTPAFVTKNVSGYVYYSPSSYEDGIKDNFVILDVPVNTKDSSGNEPLLSQMTSYLQTEEASDWNNPDNQEMYNQITSELPTWKPLPEYNSGAKVMSVYSDPNTDTPLSIETDGHFEGTVSVKTTDSTVNFQVVTENKYNETQAISSSDITSQSTAPELKSCPERILSLPGGIELFEVYCPSVNLKQAGLTFTLNNSSLGCVTKPFYLTICGKANYNVAYGFFYAKKGLTTPVDSVITAKTTTGLTLSIFTEVIKSTASISGQVKGSPVFGYVCAIGTDGFSLLDSSGNYRLPKVFKGHYREVVAVWWANEGGKLVRHREVKIIPFFNGDLSGFNFSTIIIGPTPTVRPPEDPFYNNQISKVTYQFEQWKKEFGIEQAIEMTVNWLNGNTGLPVPEGILESERDSFDNDPVIWVYFTDGMAVSIGVTPGIFESTVSQEQNTNLLNNRNDSEKQQNKVNAALSSPITSSNATMFKPNNILILSPFEHQFYTGRKGTFDILMDLQDAGYEDKLNRKLVHIDEMSIDFDNPVYPDGAIYFPCRLSLSGDRNNIPTPWDYERIGNYGLVYILTHGWEQSLVVGPWLEDDEETNRWVRIHRIPDMIFSKKHESGIYIEHYQYIGDLSRFVSNPKIKNGYLRCIILRKVFFAHLNNNPSTNFDGSVIFIAGCKSSYLSDAFNSAEIYLGCNTSYNSVWMEPLSYYFFFYMMYGPIEPTDILGYDHLKVFGTPPPDRPLHVEEAYNALKNYYKVIPDPRPGIKPLDRTLLDIYPKNSNNEIYFPGTVQVIIN